MSGLSAELRTRLVNDGYVVLVAIVLIGALGAPLPNSIVLLAAGGFAAEGDLNVVAVTLLTIAASVSGDCTVLLLARWLGAAAVERYGRRIGLGPKRIDAASKRMGRWTWATIYMTRWLLTPIAVPVDVLAGIGRYPVLAFASGRVAGDVTWAMLYVGIGYVVGQAWSQVTDIVGNVAGLVSGTVVAGVAVVIGVKIVRNRSNGLGHTS